MDEPEDGHLRAAEVTQYRINPCPQTLSPIASRAEHLRRSPTEAYRERRHWRIAQHLALAWSNRLGVATLAPDFTRAAYFAHVSCQLSNEHPWARFVRASIYWERRLTYLVLDDAGKAANDLARLDDPAQAQFLLRQLDSLRTRVRMNLGDELLAVALERDQAQLDKKLFFDVFAPPQPKKPAAKKR